MGGLISLVFQIDADPSKAQAALDAFAAKTGQSIGLVQAQIKDYQQAESAAYDEAVQRARNAGKQLDESLQGNQEALLNSRESVRLLTEQFGIHLPRAVTGAIAKIEGLNSVLKIAGEVALTVFALREVAEAITNWDHFKDKVTEIIGPFSELEVKVANSLGFLKEYSKAAREAEEDQRKYTKQQQGLIDRQRSARYALMILQDQGIQKIKNESREKVEALEKEKMHVDTRNQSYVDGLITIERQTEKEKEREFFIEQSAEAARKADEAQRKRDEQERKARAEVLSQRKLITGLFEQFYIKLNDIDPIEQKFIHNQEEIAKVTDAATRALLEQMNVQERDKAVAEELAKTQKALADSMAEATRQMAAEHAEEQKSQEKQMQENLTRAVKEMRERAKEMHLAWMEQYTDLKMVTERVQGSLIPQFNYAAASMRNLKVIGLDSLNSLEQAMGSNLAMALAYGENVGKAMKKAAQEEVASIAEKALVKSLEALATGFYLLAVQDYTGAGQAFTSAGLWGSIGGAAAVAARAMGGHNAGAGSGAGSGAGAGANASGGGGADLGIPPQTLAPGAAGAGGRYSGLNVTIIGEHEAGQWMAATLNKAVDRGITLTATSSQRGAPVGH